MRILVGMLLAVIATASSTTATADTLRVISYRDIDICSSERRFLIAAYMGQIREQDSLQSFDITLGYDTSVLRPTDGLIVGTLSDQMRFGDLSPSFNFSIPGELRVGAFTITRNVNGDLPLFAVAGTWLGSCGETGSFVFPWPHDFNPEFKKSITVAVSDTIRSIVVARVDLSQGSSLSMDSTDMGTDSTTVIGIESRQEKLTGLQLKEYITVNDDKSSITIDTVEAPDALEVNIDLTRTSAEITRRANTDSTYRFNVVLRRIRIDTVEATLRVTTSLDDTCGCVKPGEQDSMVIQGSGIATSVESTQETDKVLHEGAVMNSYVIDNELNIQSLHGQPLEISLSTVEGSTVYHGTLAPYENMILPLESWSTGMYIIQARGPHIRATKKITK